MSKLETARTIFADHKAGKGSVAALCREHRMAPSMFYAYRKQFVPKSKKVRVMSARRKFVDIPLTAPTKYYIVVCESADAVRELVK